MKILILSSLLLSSFAFAFADDYNCIVGQQVKRLHLTREKSLVQEVDDYKLYLSENEYGSILLSVQKDKGNKEEELATSSGIEEINLQYNLPKYKSLQVSCKKEDPRYQKSI
jgi:hypothetical protein